MVRQEHPALKARNRIAQGGASPTSAALGSNPIKNQALQGRDNLRCATDTTPPVPPLQGWGLWLTDTWGSTPGFHRTGLQPFEARSTPAQLSAASTRSSRCREQRYRLLRQHHQVTEFRNWLETEHVETQCRWGASFMQGAGFTDHRFRCFVNRTALTLSLMA